MDTSRTRSRRTRTVTAASPVISDARRDEILLKLAQQVRAVFVAHYCNLTRALTGRETDWGSRPMMKWDGGDDDRGHHQPIWPKIVARCLELDADPSQYVQAQFSVTERLPLPNALLSQAATQTFLAYRQLRPAQLMGQLRQQEQTMVSEARCRAVLRKSDTAEEMVGVLRDQNIQLSPLYRFCVAVKTASIAAQRQFHDQALRQYLFERDLYDLAWGRLIPVALKAEAQAIFDRLKG